MSKAFTLDIRKSPKYEVEHNGLVVTIQPLTKREEKKLIDRHTKGRVTILQDRQRKGFRQKQGGKDEITLPDVDYLELNIERAKLTWKDWNVTFEGKKVPCDDSNLETFFDNYYDSYVVPILDKLEEIVDAGESPVSDSDADEDGSENDTKEAKGKKEGKR